MDKEAARSLAKWAKDESRKIIETDEHNAGPGTPHEKWILGIWEAQRPDLIAAMKEWGALTPLAHVISRRMIRSQIEYQKAGMTPSDAKMQAFADWAMTEEGATVPQ